MKAQNRFFLLLGMMLVLSILASCTTFKATDLAVLKDDIPSMRMICHFEREVMVPEFLGSPGGINLLNLSADAMTDFITEIIDEEISKNNGNGAINVKLEYNVTVWDILSSSLTYGVWAPAHLIISGDIIQYNTYMIGNIDTEESVRLSMSNF